MVSKTAAWGSIPWSPLGVMAAHGRRLWPDLADRGKISMIGVRKRPKAYRAGPNPGFLGASSRLLAASSNVVAIAHRSRDLLSGPPGLDVSHGRQRLGAAAARQQATCQQDNPPVSGGFEPSTVSDCWTSPMNGRVWRVAWPVSTGGASGARHPEPVETMRAPMRNAPPAVLRACAEVPIAWR
jgi:hypothetical protein